MIGHPHVQERWEHPEEEYYVAKHGLDASPDGVKGSGSEELEIDAGPKGGSKAKKMHPFGQGIRQVFGQLVQNCCVMQYGVIQVLTWLQHGDERVGWPQRG